MSGSQSRVPSRSAGTSHTECSLPFALSEYLARVKAVISDAHHTIAHAQVSEYSQQSEGYRAGGRFVSEVGAETGTLTVVKRSVEVVPKQLGS